jgi:hypothetical protein
MLASAVDLRLLIGERTQTRQRFESCYANYNGEKGRDITTPSNVACSTRMPLPAAMRAMAVGFHGTDFCARLH